MFKICALALTLLASSAQAAADFDWAIEDPSIDIKFDDARGDSEIILNYTAANQTTRVQIFDYDNCNTTDSADAITTDGTPARTGEVLLVELDFNQTAIPTSSLYTAPGTGETVGVIEVCVRVDLDESGVGSVNFHESKLRIEVDMTKGFEVTDVETDRTAATQTNETAELDYDVLAFEINDDNNEEITNGVYAQGSFLTIGIITNSTSGVNVADIIQMNITGDTDYDSIDSAGTESSLTEKTCEETITPTVESDTAAEGCKVKTMLVSDFFVNESPTDLTVKGIAVMEFKRARRLSSINARGLQEASTADDTFGLTVSLKPMDMGEDNIDNNVDMVDDSAAAPASVVAGMASFVVAVFSFFLM